MCDTSEAAQLELQLRSLGCELVTLRSRLPATAPTTTPLVVNTAQPPLVATAPAQTLSSTTSTLTNTAQTLSNTTAQTLTNTAQILPNTASTLQQPPATQTSANTAVKAANKTHTSGIVSNNNIDIAPNISRNINNKNSNSNSNQQNLNGLETTGTLTRQNINISNDKENNDNLSATNSKNILNNSNTINSNQKHLGTPIHQYEQKQPNQQHFQSLSYMQQQESYLQQQNPSRQETAAVNSKQGQSL